MKIYIAGLVLAAAICGSTGYASAELKSDVHILFRAFIPREHPSLSNFFPITDAGFAVIRAPLPEDLASDALGRLAGKLLKPVSELVDLYPELRGTCFATDDRTYSNDPNSSSRMTVEFILKIRGRDMQVESTTREMKRTGVTRNVDCKTGKDIRAPRQEDTTDFSIGPVKNGPFTRTIFVKASGNDPFYTKGITIDIDFSFSMQYNIASQSLNIKGTINDFPSYEGYYSINGEPLKPFVKMPPANGVGPGALFDANLGLNSRNFSGEINLKP